MSGVDFNISTSDYFVNGYEIRNNLNQHLTTNLASLHVPSQATHSGKFLKTNGTSSSWEVLIVDIAQVNKAQKVATVLSTDGQNKCVYAFAFPTAGLYHVKGTISSGTSGYLKYLVLDQVVASTGTQLTTAATIHKAMYNSTDFSIKNYTTDSQLGNQLQFHTNAEVANVSYVINLLVTSLSTITLDTTPISLIQPFLPMSDGSLNKLLFFDFASSMMGGSITVDGSNFITQMTELSNSHVLVPYQGTGITYNSGGGYIQFGSSGSNSLREANGYNMAKPFYAGPKSLGYTFYIVADISNTAGSISQTVCAGGSSLTYETQLIHNTIKVAQSPRLGIAGASVTAITPPSSQGTTLGTGKHIYRFTYKVTGTPFVNQTATLYYYIDGVQLAYTNRNVVTEGFGGDLNRDYRPRVFASSGDNLTLGSRDGGEPAQNQKWYEIGLFNETDKFLTGGQYETFEQALKVKYGIA